MDIKKDYPNLTKKQIITHFNLKKKDIELNENQDKF